MADCVGVGFLHWPSIRRQLFLFDRLGIWQDISLLPSQGRRDMQFLIDRGVMFGVDSLTFGERGNRSPDHRELHDELMKTKTSIDGDLFIRALASEVRLKDQCDTVPLVRRWIRDPSKPCAKRDVLRLVINALPAPGEDVPFDDVVAFREEARAEGRLQELRVWMNEMASGKITEFEIADKLDDLVSRYDRGLRLEKMSRTTGAIETLVVTSAEVAEALVKLS